MANPQGRGVKYVSKEQWTEEVGEARQIGRKVRKKAGKKGRKGRQEGRDGKERDGKEGGKKEREEGR